MPTLFSWDWLAQFRTFEHTFVCKSSFDASNWQIYDYRAAESQDGPTGREGQREPKFFWRLRRPGFGKNVLHASMLYKWYLTVPSYLNMSKISLFFIIEENYRIITILALLAADPYPGAVGAATPLSALLGRQKFELQNKLTRIWK